MLLKIQIFKMKKSNSSEMTVWCCFIKILENEVKMNGSLSWLGYRIKSYTLHTCVLNLRETTWKAKSYLQKTKIKYAAFLFFLVHHHKCLKKKKALKQYQFIAWGYFFLKKK